MGYLEMKTPDTLIHHSQLRVSIKSFIGIWSCSEAVQSIMVYTAQCLSGGCLWCLMIFIISYMYVVTTVVTAKLPRILLK